MPQELWQKHLSTKQPVIFRAEDGLRYLKTFRWEIISLYIYTYNMYIYMYVIYIAYVNISFMNLQSYTHTEACASAPYSVKDG